MIYSFDLSKFEEGKFTATRFSDNSAIGGDWVCKASDDKEALALAKKAARSEWAAPEARDPEQFEVVFLN